MVPLLPSSLAWYWVHIRPRRKEVTVPLPWRTPEVADTVFSTPDDGCMTPKTCRVTWQRINVYILSHRVGPLLTLQQGVSHKYYIFRACLQPYLYSMSSISTVLHYHTWPVCLHIFPHCFTKQHNFPKYVNKHKMRIDFLYRKNCPMRTDRQNETNSCFSQFCKSA